MSQRVTFIVPPSGFLLDERVFPSLGILRVAAVLEAQGHDVSVLDLSGVEDVVGAVTASVQDRPADVYGITATMPQMPLAAQAAQAARALAPLARLVLGGPHPTLLQASARQERQRGQAGRASRALDELCDLFDVLVCGDGERAMAVAMSEAPPAVVDADDHQSDLFLESSDLDALPMAARHLIDLESYHYTVDGVRAYSVIAQLGCPFGCQFCGGRRSPFLRRIRSRSTAAVLAEVRHLHLQYGACGFMFFDDELNVNRQFIELLDGLDALQTELGVSFRLRGFLKAELVTQPMAQSMYRSGFRQVLMGVESGSPRILQNIRKNATREDNTRAVDRLRRAGIGVKAAMSIGHAGESDETIEASRQWLLQVQPDDFDVSIITVYPGTPYYDDAEPSGAESWTYVDPRSGDRLHMCAVDHLSQVNFYKGVPGEYQSFVWTDYVTCDGLRMRRDALEDEVRSALSIPAPASVAARRYEHSMAAMGAS